MKMLLENKAFASIIVFFFILCIGYYLGSDLGLFPDESPHLGYVLDVAKLGFPDYTEGMIYDANKLNRLEHPALYYMLVGGVKKIALIFDMDLYKSLRFVNVIISLLTLVIIYSSLKEFRINTLAIALSLMTLLCIPMFVLLSASINNDPLTFLGCALAFHGLVLYYNNSSLNKVLIFFIAGGVIVSLTKATGALSIACIIFIFFIVEIKNLKHRLKELSIKNVFFLLTSILLIATYYSITFFKYGSFFPAPQGDPSDWYKAAHPNAHRFTITEQVVAFYQSNLHTLLIPYGYKPFFDLNIREQSLKILLVMFSILTILFTFKNMKNRYAESRFYLVCVFSFLIFMCFYFITIHRMNLKTGYPGAMQARYFFGFLPAFIIISALNYQKIRLKIIKLGLCSLVFLTSVLSLYPAYQPTVFELLSPSYGQIWSDTVVGELTEGKVFEQTFKSQYKKLSSIDLYMATYARNNTGLITLDIIDEQRELIGSSNLNSADLSDNSWATFKFHNITLIKGGKYKLRLTAKNSTSGNAVTWYAFSGKYPYPMFAGTPFGPSEKILGRYTDGQGYIDGQPADLNFTFRIYGESWQTTLKSKFIN